MTIAQIAQLVRLITNTNSVTLSDSNLLRSASERQKQVVKVMTDMREGYLETTSSSNLVAGTQAYALPANLRLKRIEVLYVTGGTWRPVTFFDIDERKGANDTTTIASDFSQQYPYADITGDNVSLYPIPDANVTNGLKFWYVAVPADFTATSDTPVIPAELHRALCDLIAIDVRQMKNELSTAQAVQEEAIVMQMIRGILSPRVHDQDSVVKARRVNYE